MSLLLKLRLKSLTTLSRQIRKTETQALTRTQSLRIEARLRASGIPTRQMARIMKRANKRTVRRLTTAIRSEGVLIRTESGMDLEWIKEAEAARSTMHTLRTAYLRRELRAGYLAYAFLRDVPFDTVEWQAHEPVPMDRVEEIIGEYTPADQRQIVAQKFAEWAEHIQVSIGEGRHPRQTQDEGTREWRRDREQAMRAW